MASLKGCKAMGLVDFSVIMGGGVIDCALSMLGMVRKESDLSGAASMVGDGLLLKDRYKPKAPSRKNKQLKMIFIFSSY